MASAKPRNVAGAGIVDATEPPERDTSCARPRAPGKCLGVIKEVTPMRRSAIFAVFAGLLAVSPVFAQTAIELKKELLPKIKKAQADGKDLGQAQELYNEGDKLLKDGMNEEAVEAFKKAKTAMPKD
jgi:hypothetical protein